jgi:hypothetical protein
MGMEVARFSTGSWQESRERDSRRRPEGMR